MLFYIDTHNLLLYENMFKVKFKVHNFQVFMLEHSFSLSGLIYEMLLLI